MQKVFLLSFLGFFLFVSGAWATTLEEFLKNPANQEAFNNFPSDVQEQMRKNETKLKESEAAAKASLPEGTVMCFDHYNPNSIQMFLEPTTLTPVAGSMLQFRGKIKNENPYPVVNGLVYVKIFHEQQSSEENAVKNGYPLVDQFIAVKDIVIPANGEREASFEWAIPTYTEGGQYYAALYFATHERYVLSGILFMDDVTGNQVGFKIMNSENTEKVVTFNRNGATLNEYEYNFSRPPKLLKKDEEATIGVTLVNPRDEEVSVPVTWKLSPWGDLQDRVIDTKEEFVLLKPKETKSVSYVVKPHDDTISNIVVTLEDKGVRSIQNIRFARNDVPETRLEFPTILHYPLKAGQETGVFTCTHSTNVAKVDNNEILLKVLDENDEIIFAHKYSGSIPSDMTGILGKFTPEKDTVNFSVEATLTRDGYKVESVKQTYSCKDLNPSLCPQENKLVAVAKDPLKMAILGFIGFLGILSLILIVRHVRKMRRRTFMWFLFAFASMMFFPGVEQVEAKSITAPFMFHNDPYGNGAGGSGFAAVAAGYPDCSEGQFTRGDGTVVYSIEATNLNTGAIVNDGASIAVGTPVRFRLQNDNDYSTRTVYWRTIRGGCYGSPSGAWVPGAARTGATPLSINPPTMNVRANDNGRTVFSCSSQTDCTVTATGPASVTVDFSATYGRYYQDYTSCDPDTGFCSPATEVMAFPLSAQAINLSFFSFDPNAPPTAPLINGSTNGSSSGQVNIPAAFSVTSTDPDGDNLREGIDWDDNGSIDEWVSDYAASGLVKTATHTWSAPGVYRFRAIAEDQRGGLSSWSFHTITISATPPVPAPTVNLVPTIGSVQKSWWKKFFSEVFGKPQVAEAGGTITIREGGRAVLTWTTTNTPLICNMTSTWPGFTPLAVNPAGGNLSVLGLPQGSHTFTITCNNAGGSVVDNALVLVDPPLYAASLIICPVSSTVGEGLTQQVRAYYTAAGDNPPADCNALTGNNIDYTGLVDWTSSSPANATIDNGVNKGLVRGVSAGSTNISARHIPSGLNSQVITMTVLCTPTNSCTSPSSQATAAGICSGDTFVVADGCGLNLDCPGERYCNYNWREVAP